MLSCEKNYYLIKSPLSTPLGTSCAAGNTNPLDPAAWNTGNVQLSLSVGGITDTKTVTPKFYSTSNLATAAVPTSAISWDGPSFTCSNMVRYLEVTYTLSSTLTIESASIKIVYGSLTSTDAPSIVYSAVNRNTVRSNY